MSTASFEWVERIQQAILDLDQQPQFGSPTSFPLNAFNNQLKQIFGKSSLSIRMGDMRWMPSHLLLEGMGEDVQFSEIIFSPLEPKVIWGISQQDLSGLLASLLDIENEKTILLEEEIYKGFYQFISIEALNLVGQTGFLGNLSPQLRDGFNSKALAEDLPASFRIDISIQLKERSFWGFLIISDAFRDAWKRHFAINTPDVLDPVVAQKISLDVALEVGSSELVLSEWQQAKLGDFVILDHCSFDPDLRSGRLILTVNGQAIFRAKIREEEIKLLEYPLYEMKGENMDRELDDEDDEFFGDLDDLDEDEDEELDEDEDLGESLDEELSNEQESSSPGSEKIEEDNSYLKPENIPIQLTVEVGRIKMTALELMNLQPGNLIDVKVVPEKGVDLVLNGKKVGRGELIKMGDVLGVRIVKI